MVDEVECDVNMVTSSAQSRRLSGESLVGSYHDSHIRDPVRLAS